MVSNDGICFISYLISYIYVRYDERLIENAVVTRLRRESKAPVTTQANVSRVREATSALVYLSSWSSHAAFSSVAW